MITMDVEERITEMCDELAHADDLVDRLMDEVEQQRHRAERAEIALTRALAAVGVEVDLATLDLVEQYQEARSPFTDSMEWPIRAA